MFYLRYAISFKFYIYILYNIEYIHVCKKISTELFHFFIETTLHCISYFLFTLRYQFIIFEKQIPTILFRQSKFYTLGFRSFDRNFYKRYICMKKISSAYLKHRATKKRSMNVSKERLNSRAIHAITLRNPQCGCPVKVLLLAAFFIARTTRRRVSAEAF